MKKIVSGLLVLLLSLSVQAGPITINDDYIGAKHNATYGDVIGSSSSFGIDSMTVEIIGSILTVQINTLFGDNGLGTFDGNTTNPLTGVNDGKGIGFGDLFLSSSGWNPWGDDPYTLDDNTNGTFWDYGIALDDRWSKSSGASLYELNGATNDDNAHLSDDFLTGAIFRNGQEIAVDIGSNDTRGVNNAATFDSTNYGQILFTLNIAGTALENADSIGIHWGMTCGNDTIEGQYTAPEPATMVMLLTGMLFLGVVGLRRKQLAINPD